MLFNDLKTNQFFTMIEMQNFDDFAFTGLNNFDFYTSEFFIHGFEDYVKDVI